MAKAFFVGRGNYLKSEYFGFFILKSWDVEIFSFCMNRNLNLFVLYGTILRFFGFEELRFRFG